MEKKYFLGRRFNKIARFSYAATVILSVYAAVIYDYLFPNVSGRAVMVLYLIWGMACLIAEKILFDRARKKIYYVLSEKFFTAHGFGNSVRGYALENITAVEEEKFSHDICKVKFLFGQEIELKINNCLDDPCGVALEIIGRLKKIKNIEIEESIIEKLEALSIPSS